jgi:DNA-binding NarL/FixJ family response regulator
MDAVPDRKLTVVLVDDQPLIRDLVKLRLNLDGRFDVVAEAHSGGEALALIRNHRPDAVVLDVNMPGISGLTVIPAIAEECPDTKIVVYTGFNDGALEDEAFLRGADFVADKLMNMDDLAVAIAALCGYGDPAGEGSDNTSKSSGNSSENR